MEQFERAKTVRLRSSHGKYLYADEDMVSVSQQRDSGEMAVWQVEPVADESGSNTHPVIRLKSAFGCYLGASEEAFLLGMTGKKVLQMRKGESGTWLDSWVEWEPVAEPHSSLVKMRTRHGNYLRGNGLIFPWRNSVTHDVPVRTATQNWVLWDVEVVESSIQREHVPDLKHQPGSRNHEMKQQLSFKIPVSDGRRIAYTVVSDTGEEIVGDEKDWPCFYFKGHTLAQLKEAFIEELGLENDDHLLVCTRNVVSGKLYPLQLGLPPNNAPMNLVLVSK